MITKLVYTVDSVMARQLVSHDVKTSTTAARTPRLGLASGGRRLEAGSSSGGFSMTKRLKKLAAMSLSLSVFCAVTLVCLAQTKSSTRSVRTSVNEEKSSWNWHHNDSAVDLQVTIRGKVEFADDYSDIKSISDGGNIRVKDDRRGGQVRKFEASAEGGSINRSYSINGQPSSFDDDARKWLAKVLHQTVRLGGYDAQARVRKLLERNGPRAVLAEISQLESDYVKRIYFDELFAQGQLDADSARQALKLAATQLPPTTRRRSY